MSRIKGIYKGNITITVDFDENQDGLLPFEVMKERFMKDMTGYIQDELKDLIEVGDMGKVAVEQLSAELWRETDEQ